MPQTTPLLDAIEVKSPCTMSWDGMSGDDRVRHCRACRLDVYDLSGMTRQEAESLIRARQGRLCARFHRRPDGTIVTRDCGEVVGARRRWRLAASAVMLLGMATAAIAAARHGGGDAVDDHGRRMRLEQVVAPWRTIPVLGHVVDALLPPPAPHVALRLVGPPRP